MSSETLRPAHRVACVALATVFLIFAGHVAAGENGLTRSNITDAERLQLAIQVLEDAVNSPNDINLTNLEMISDDPAFGQTRERISSLLTSGRDSLEWDRVKLEPITIVDSKGIFRLKARLLYENPYGLVEDTLEVTAIKSGKVLRIRDMGASLSQMDSFISEERKNLPKTPKARTRSLSQASIEILNPVSENLLRPRNLHGSIERFNGHVNDSLIEDDPDTWNTLFNRPYGLLAFEYQDQVAPYDILRVSDANWDRVIVSSADMGWLSTAGSSGTGDNNFRFPSGLAWANWRFYVADKYNDRIGVYDFDTDAAEPHADFVRSFEDDFDMPVDVAAAALEREPGWVYRYPAVLDQGNNRVVVYDMALGTSPTVYPNDRVHFSGGLDKPTSLCYARNPVTHAPHQRMYVADNGNGRIVSFVTDVPKVVGGYECETAPGTFEDNAYLAWVDVDNFGYVYALDAHNSIVYKFDWALNRLIAKFGSGGTEDHQFLFPNCLAFGRIARYSASGPSIHGDAGDVFLTEHFGEDTGIRRYIQGFDVLTNSTEYMPKYLTWNHDYIRCKYFVTGHTRRTVEIYRNSALVQSWGNELKAPGEHWATWELPDDAIDGEYVFKVDLRSLYDSSLDTVFWDTINVVRMIDSVHVGCRFVLDSVTIKSDVEGDGDGCMYIGTGPVYKATVFVHDSWESEPLGGPYTWHQFDGGNVMFHRSPDYLGGDTLLTTDSNFVYFTLWSSEITGDMQTLFLGVIGFEDSTTTGRTPGLASLFTLDPFADSCGVFRVKADVYQRACYTPCYSPCPSCPFLYAWNGTEYEFVNNILPQCETFKTADTDQLDFYPVYTAAPEKSVYYKFLITEEEQEISYLNELEVLAFDYFATSQEVVFNNSQNLITSGDTTLPVSAVTDDGRDVLKSLLHKDGERFTSRQPGYIELEYVTGGGRDRGEPAIAEPPKEEIDIIVDDGPVKGGTPKQSSDVDVTPVNSYTISCANVFGRWELVERIHPRIKSDRRYISVSDFVNEGSLKIRLEWAQSIDIDWLPYVSSYRVEATPVRLKLVSAEHSSSGDRTSVLDKDNDSRVVLQPGERIELTYEAESPPLEGQSRTFMFGARGWYESYASQSGEPSSEELPTGLTLEQNYPNPFNPVTTFHFALPAAEHVTFEIYNILGQKVVTLLDADCGPGKHTVQWDCTMDNGRTAASGVYFAKLKAGDSETTRKMMVVK